MGCSSPVVCLPWLRVASAVVVVVVFVTPPRGWPGVGLVARGSLALAAVDSVEEVLGLLQCLEALVAVAIEALD